MDDSPQITWSIDRAAVAYSFLANIAVLMGFSPEQNKFLLKLCNELFKEDPRQKDSQTYKFLKSLGKLPISYHINEIIKYSTVQKQKIKEWYIEVLTLDTMMEISPYALIELKRYNQLIFNL